MSKLREKLAHPFDGLKIEALDQLEQITDDFSIQFGDWLLDNYITNTPIEQLQQYFKDNVYGK
jgi:hypothetical protein